MHNPPTPPDPVVSGIERNPVTLVEVIRAVFVLGGLTGVIAWDDTRVTVAVGALLVIVSAGLQLVARAHVTPLVDPRDDDGTRLVRLDTGVPPQRAQDYLSDSDPDDPDAGHWPDPAPRRS